VNEKLGSKTSFPDELRRTRTTVGDISVVVKDAEVHQGLPRGKVYVTLPETGERPGVVISADVGLAHPTTAYLRLNKVLQGRGYAPENGVLRNAVYTALDPYVRFVEQQEPEFKRYD